MHSSALPDAAFVELYNRSANSAFNLSGWRLDGADFAFPGGTVISPGGFLVVAATAPGFSAAYGGTIPLAGLFEGTLDDGGKTLRLVQPAP